MDVFRGRFVARAGREGIGRLPWRQDPDELPPVEELPVAPDELLARLSVARVDGVDEVEAQGPAKHREVELSNP